MLKMILIGTAVLALLGIGVIGFAIADNIDVDIIPDGIGRRGGNGCYGNDGGAQGSAYCQGGGGGGYAGDCAGSGSEECAQGGNEDCPNYDGGECPGNQGGCSGGC